MHRFEIDPAGAIALAVSGILTILMLEGGYRSALSLAYALMTGVVTLVACRIWPGRIGQGDIGVMALLGLIGGPDFLLLLLWFFVLSALLTSAGYSWSRGKRLFRSMFPVALPAMAAAAPVFCCRLAVGLWPESGVSLLSRHTLNALVGRF